MQIQRTQLVDAAGAHWIAIEAARLRMFRQGSTDSNDEVERRFNEAADRAIARTDR